MTTNPIQAFYDAAARADMPAILDEVSEDILIEEPAFLPHGGTYRGKAGLQRMLAEASEMADFTSLRIERLLVDGHGGFAVLRLRHRKTGNDILVAEETHLASGKIAKLRIYIHDAGSALGP